ncbi:MAG: hypothetical protein ACUZ8E_07060 [Candidatus Anammoxibacter sp.]
MKLRDKAEALRMVIDRKVDILDIEALLGKLSDMVNISGLAAEIAPSAKLEYRNKQETVILDLMENPVNLSASATNELIKARSAKEESFAEYCALLDKRLSYGIDALRSIISLRKVEIQNSL